MLVIAASVNQMQKDSIDDIPLLEGLDKQRGMENRIENAGYIRAFL